MQSILPILLKDGYKIGHPFQYPSDTTLIYSNLTPRKGRDESLDGVIGFGYQYFVLECLIRQFQTNFFLRSKDQVMREYRRRIDHYLGPDAITYDHIEALHGMGYLPLTVKALPEGLLSPFRVPLLTLKNDLPQFFWLTNMVETLLSNVLWKGITSATTAFNYRRTFERWAKQTGAPQYFVKWQGHDFSFRGMSGIEDACLSGAAHLLSFTGTDTIPAIDFLEMYYGADCEKELIGGSVPATEHSVMCMGAQGGERETIKRLITEVYPKGIVSIVCDTWDFWKVLTEILPSLKAEILARDGKVVVRPDSGDPVKITVGDITSDRMCVRDGAIETLFKTFGGVATGNGYIQLDPHIGYIYGDSITRERQSQILSGLALKGFASSNVVLGIGSYTYQYRTRDDLGIAMKATYGATVSLGAQAIFKKPATDDGTKNSAKGLLRVDTQYNGPDHDDSIVLREDQTWTQESGGLLQTIFSGGQARNLTTLQEIRDRIESQL